MCEDAWGIMMVSCKRVHEWWNAKHFHISTSLVRSQVRQDRIRAHSKPTKPKMSKFNKKRQRAPRDLFHPIKPCLGLAIGRYIGIFPITKQLTADLPKHPSSFHGKLNKVCWIMQAGHEWTLWVWWQDYPSDGFPTWKNPCSIGGKSPYKTIISQHFCGRHTVASLDDLRGFIAEIPPKKNV